MMKFDYGVYYDQIDHCGIHKCPQVYANRFCLHSEARGNELGGVVIVHSPLCSIIYKTACVFEFIIIIII